MAARYRPIDMGTRRLATVGAAIVLGGVLAGCSAATTPEAGTSPEATASPTGSVPPSPSPTPTTAPVGSAPASPSPPFTFPPSGSDKSAPAQPDQTVVGQVEPGVEPGCLILRDTTGTYELLGGDPTIVYAGSNVSLTGHVVTGVMSHCMQGKPFQITQSRRR